MLHAYQFGISKNYRRSDNEEYASKTTVKGLVYDNYSIKLKYFDFVQLV